MWAGGKVSVFLALLNGCGNCVSRKDKQYLQTEKWR